MPESDTGQRPFRFHRSSLFVPCTSEKFFAKAAAGEADCIILDLEDSVALDKKQSARAAAVEAINTVDWGSKTVAVRINGLDSPWTYKDVVALAENCPRLDLIVLPMVNAPQDVRFLDTLLGQIEAGTGRESPVGIEGSIETALGLANVEAIAASSPRLEGLGFGAGDYAANMDMPNRVVGASDPNYAVLAAPDGAGVRERHLGDQWHYAMARLANACRAYGLRPKDSAYADFKDLEGYRAAALRAAALGFEGKSAIHPSQVPIANEVFSPSPEQIAWAGGILKTMEELQRQGHGALAIDGEMIDLAHIKLARNILAKAGRMEAGQPSSQAGA
ncbi:MAG: CoA ester lyase [SAR324 cluster bacterium]|nr:CoA ester lyase [SAR324 cluster bacterium]